MTSRSLPSGWPSRPPDGREPNPNQLGCVYRPPRSVKERTRFVAQARRGLSPRWTEPSTSQVWDDAFDLVQGASDASDGSDARFHRGAVVLVGRHCGATGRGWPGDRAARGRQANRSETGHGRPKVISVASALLPRCHPHRRVRLSGECPWCLSGAWPPPLKHRSSARVSCVD
jgi:hypothetical protein